MIDNGVCSSWSGRERGKGKSRGGKNSAQRKHKGIPDVVDNATAAMLAIKIATVPQVRTNLVRKAKEDIANDRCDTPEKLNKALDKMLEELSEEQFLNK